jgi:hypothetical protein
MAAPTPVNYSATIDEVTTQQFMRGEWNDTKQQRALLERLDAKGNIDEEGEGVYAEWRSRVGEYQDSTRTDLAQRNFARKQHRITATLPWSFLEVEGVLSDRDIMLNKGKSAIVKLKETMVTEMSDDFKKRINKRLLTSNSGTTTSMGNAVTTDTVHGLPTVFNTGATLYARGTTTALEVTDKYVASVGNYAGHSIARSGLTGVDNALADAWSPYLVNTGYDWAGDAGETSSNAWAGNCIHVANDMMTGLAHGDSEGEFPDLGIMTKAMFTQFKAKLFNKQRIAVGESPTSPNVGMYPRFHIPFEGATFVYDADMTADNFYLLNTSKMQLKCVPAGTNGSPTGELGGSAAELFGVTQQHSIEQGGHLAVVTLASQLCIDPRYHGAAYTWDATA